MKKNYLQIESISKYFDRTVALEQVSLDIMEGEFIFLLGPSGCGKTTLLRIIAGLEVPTAGRIIQDGQDVTHLPPAKRNFGIVFQSYALFPNLTVFQNIAYGLENRRESKSRIKDRVDDLLSLMKLDDLDSRFPAQLSGGQQQRVALARALAISPSLLLLDEPLSALDARVRTNLRIEITRLQRKLGITTVMVSHDQEEALTMADRVVVIDKGRLKQVGAPEEIYHQPATPFIADFVGLMNFIPGIVSTQDPRMIQVGREVLCLEESSAPAPGETVILAIRPERVQVVQNGQNTNVLRTQVHKVEFMGPFYRLHLRYTQDSKMIAYMPPENELGDSIQEGMEVSVHLPPQYLRLYPSYTYE